MATNVTQKDKTLQEIIEWCENGRSTLVKFLQQTPLLGIVGTTSCTGRIRAYEGVIHHCKDMLGSGSMPSCLTYEDIDDSSPDVQPQVGDYGLAIRENAHGQEEIPFHIEREEYTGLPVALLNTQPYAKPEDDIDDGQYVSLFQLYLDGFVLSRTGRNATQDQSEDTN